MKNQRIFLGLYPSYSNHKHIKPCKLENSVFCHVYSILRIKAVIEMMEKCKQNCIDFFLLQNKTICSKNGAQTSNPKFQVVISKLNVNLVSTREESNSFIVTSTTSQSFLKNHVVCWKHQNKLENKRNWSGNFLYIKLRTKLAFQDLPFRNNNNDNARLKSFKRQ